MSNLYKDSYQQVSNLELDIKNEKSIDKHDNFYSNNKLIEYNLNEENCNKKTDRNIKLAKSNTEKIFFAYGKNSKQNNISKEKRLLSANKKHHFITNNDKKLLDKVSNNNQILHNNRYNITFINFQNNLAEIENNKTNNFRSFKSNRNSNKHLSKTIHLNSQTNNININTILTHDDVGNGTYLKTNNKTNNLLSNLNSPVLITNSEHNIISNDMYTTNTINAITNTNIIINSNYIHERKNSNHQIKNNLSVNNNLKYQNDKYLYKFENTFQDKENNVLLTSTNVNIRNLNLKLAENNFNNSKENFIMRKTNSNFENKMFRTNYKEKFNNFNKNINNPEITTMNNFDVRTGFNLTNRKNSKNFKSGERDKTKEKEGGSLEINIFKKDSKIYSDNYILVNHCQDG